MRYFVCSGLLSVEKGDSGRVAVTAVVCSVTLLWTVVTKHFYASTGRHKNDHSNVKCNMLYTNTSTSTSTNTNILQVSRFPRNIFGATTGELGKIFPTDIWGNNGNITNGCKIHKIPKISQPFPLTVT